MIKMAHQFSWMAVALVGCTFSVPQAASLANLATQLKSSSNVEGATESPMWLASVGTEGAITYPYNSGNLIVFANAEGDAIAFDGWIVRSVTGFGLSTPVSVSGREGKRLIVHNDNILEVLCGPWVWRPPHWRQICGEGDGVITLDRDGNIKEITMSFGSLVAPIKLKLAD